jgi:hypothetical protein
MGLYLSFLPYYLLFLERLGLPPALFLATEETMTQTGLHGRAHAAGALSQRLFEVLARTVSHLAAAVRSSPERRSGGRLSAEIRRDAGVDLAHQDFAGAPEAGSAQRLFDIADRIRLGLPHR